MRDRPSPEQEAVIRNAGAHRIRLVSAVPGSGKTWVVARAIEHEVDGHPEAHPGLAALSFTNVAKHEVLGALGGAVGGRHFVGTLDSFLFRFVVRPFLPSVVDWPVVFQLVPASLARTMNAKSFFYEVRREVGSSDGATKMKVVASVSIFDCTRTKTGVTAKYPSGGPIDLTQDEQTAIITLKRKALSTCGFMSHSDAAFIAAKLLEGKHGAAIRDLVLTRFPFMIVDELQDTGESHARCLQSLLSDERVRALLVGDPDQSIYEFTGASPRAFAAFESLPGVHPMGLPVSRRCPNTVCQVATALSSTGREVLPLDPTRVGRALMVVRPDPHPATDFLANLPDRARVLTRKNTTLQALLGSSSKTEPTFRSKPVAALYKAIRALDDGEVRSALDIAGAALTGAAYAASMKLNRKQLEQRGMTQFQLRERAMSMLLEMVPEESEPLFQWGTRAKAILVECARQLPGAEVAGRRINGPSQKFTKGAWRGGLSLNATTTFSTVHGAKGETHDMAVFWVPTTGPKTCPSVQWWQEGEEQRIAFVACSRAKHTLVLCVHKDTHTRLRKSRPDFVDLFEVVTEQKWLDDLRVDHQEGTDV